MLVEAIRLTRRATPSQPNLTPSELMAEILEREGQFNEWQDEMTSVLWRLWS